MDESRETNQTYDDVTARAYFLTPDDDAELDPEIALYESMPMDQVNSELAQEGIDPEQTIAAVRDLLRKHLQDRRSLHLQEAILISVLLQYAATRALRVVTSRPWEGRAAPICILV